MEQFFIDFDWNSFWMNFIVSSIFLMISIFISIKLIPHFTVKLLQKKRKKYIVSKISYIIQEFCEFIEKSPFKNKDITSEQLSIFTNKKDLKNHRFIGLIDLNVLKKITHLKVRKLILESFTKMNPEDGLELVKKEKINLENFRTKLESIINYHSMDIDEEIISDVSQLCLEIRTFEIKYRYNHSIDDLIEKGLTKRKGVFGINEISDIYHLTLNLFKKLLELNLIEVEIKKKE
ncbi:hypothetical protein [Winogradskyella wichelsiae]|uniref:hypothetical protein n=1 Tax=Winogradskyella wichelsiae TaxID=2697007 RepID=UPI0015CCBAC1|nr:hypothetical protein [Winogradskyella wichelsiae]